jgi:hypothetical protein
MSPDTENFEQLRRLLKLKRYEQPPPRYFNDFASQVIARIERGDRGDGQALAGQMIWEAPWLQRLWAAFEGRPILAGAFGLAVCATLVTGVIYSERTDLQPVALIPGAQTAISSSVEIANAMAPNQASLLNAAVSAEGALTNTITAPDMGGPLFGPLYGQSQGQGARAQAQPASFTFPGGN